MASGRVYKRGAAWYLDYRTGRFVDGKRERIQKRARGASKSEAQAELDVLLARLHRANDGANDNRAPVFDLAEQWLAYVRMHASAVAHEQYTRHIERIREPMQLAGMILAEDVTQSKMEAVMSAMLNAGESANKINLSIKKLSACFAWASAKSRGLLQSNPLDGIKMLKAPRVKYRRALTEDEAAALLNVSNGMRRLLWWFLISTGLRAEEMAMLECRDVDLAKGCVYVREKSGWTPKTKAGTRTIPVKPELMAELSRLASGRPGDAPLFVTRDGTRQVNNLVRSLRTDMRAAWCRMDGLREKIKLTKEVRAKNSERLAYYAEEIKKIDVHALRYTFITELIARGTDPKTVQYLAGHSDIQTTLNIYAQCRTDRTENAVATLPW